MRVLTGIRQQVRALVVALLLMVACVGVVGVVGVTSATRTVHEVGEVVVPAELANHGVERALVDVRTSVWKWAFTADDSHLEDLPPAMRRLAREEGRLRRLTADDPEIHAAVLAQEAVTKRWLDAYPRVRIAQPAGVANLKPSLFQRENRLFERVQSSNAEVEHLLHQRLDTARASAPRHLAWTALVITLLTLVGAVVALLLGRLLWLRISGPLVRLEGVVDRLAAGDLEARATPEGPREIRRVAHALNDYIAETGRVRSMEQEMVEQLRSLDKAKTDFLSSVSHELRTPLTSITGYIEILADNLDDEPDTQQQAMFDVIHRNVDRLKTLIEDLLILSRAESETFRTAFGCVELTGLVSDAAHDMRASAAERGLTLELRLPSEPVRLWGDYGQLSRAVLNLVSNAVKFTCDGGRVVLCLTEGDGMAVLEVVDTGMGIPAAEVPKLATRFFRASNAVDAQINGTGLGLRIVQTIADNHGGRLQIDSTEGVGTTARLVLPLRAESRSLSDTPALASAG